jgi:hypothetical protein
VGGKGGGGGRGERWPKPCMHIWIIKKNQQISISWIKEKWIIDSIEESKRIPIDCITIKIILII